MGKRKVILITDGDTVARDSIEIVAENVGGRCVSLSAHNPTLLTGNEIVDLILKTPNDPVFVMVDDKGTYKEGRGEKALKQMAKHPDIEILGVVAVASNTKRAKGALVDFSVTKGKEIVDAPVDKYGNSIPHDEYLVGDTVDVLRKLNIPMVVGTGDVGKQDGADDISKEVPVTTEAVLEILWRSGYLHDHNKGKN